MSWWSHTCQLSPYSTTTFLKAGVGTTALVEVEGGAMLRCPLVPCCDWQQLEGCLGARKPADPLS